MKVCLYFNIEYYFISDKDEEESKRKSVKVNDWNVFFVEKWDNFDGSIWFEVGAEINEALFYRLKTTLLEITIVIKMGKIIEGN